MSIPDLRNTINQKGYKIMYGTDKIIKNRIGLLKLAEELGNVSKACQAMGYSRDTFYRYKQLVEEGGVDNLIDRTKKKPNLKNRVDENTERAVCEFAIAYPAYGPLRASNELLKQGICVSSGGVKSIWVRNNLGVMKDRLKALEKKVEEEGIILTEDQVAALERQKNEKEAHGEIETEHPGYLGSQDTYYVGHMKGVGRIYQQTFVDTFSKIGICKLYTSKTALTAADLLNDKVIPFLDEYRCPLLRILTDRGTEYCGKVDNHPYQLYLGINDIDHSRTKAKHPQTNGICERFHKTILTEFYQVTFRKNIYTKIETLQEHLDAWLEKYNKHRSHQGKYCEGKTPYETFIEGLEICQSKNIGQHLN